MSKYVVMAGWDDVPHLSEAQKADMMAALPPHQRDARSKGIPQLGSGAIYPVPESEIVIDDFLIPAHWQRAYGLDVGWNWTAFPYLARNPETGITYVYRAMKLGNVRPSEAIRTIHAQGRMKGAIDPAANGRGQDDGQQLIQQYRDLGADVIPANNAVEAGIFEVWQRLVAGRLKIFRSCESLLSEYRTYQRDDKGRVRKVNDHLMDALRYGVMTFLVDGAAMTTPIQRMSDEDAAMWGAVGQQRKRSGVPIGV